MRYSANSNQTKLLFELPAEAAGTLRIKAEEGDTLEIGAVICVIDESTNSVATDSDKPSGTDSKTQAETPKSTGEVKEMVVPTVGESITEVTLANWIKADGDFVELDEIIAEVDSDKATFELPAEGSGYFETCGSGRRYIRNWRIDLQNRDHGR